MRTWEPFLTARPGLRAEPPRSILTETGIRDRIRTAAFAEIQAREAFLWAADRYEDAPNACRDAWRKLSVEEDKHLSWLLRRLEEMGGTLHERPVSTRLWEALTTRPDARAFAHFMAGAEERGRDAALGFHRTLRLTDPATAEIFRAIAEEEVAHIALAARFF